MAEPPTPTPDTAHIDMTVPPHGDTKGHIDVPAGHHVDNGGQHIDIPRGRVEPGSANPVHVDMHVPHVDSGFPPHGDMQPHVDTPAGPHIDQQFPNHPLRGR